MKTTVDSPFQIPALKVNQWIKEWEKVKYKPEMRRAKPEPHFYIFSLSATKLKALSGIYRRTTAGKLQRKDDLGIQRRHDEDRSERIHQFIQYGYPWSELSAAKQKSGEFDDLRKPGWLPTAIVVNILKPENRRQGQQVAEKDLISIKDNTGSTIISLPKTFSDTGWKPTQLHPIEVIDGQHRLWAFEQDGLSGNFELPVVAFHGLDISWQAYLFWSINITPKRINPSLAFDLYPLLRTEDWLEHFEGHSIYRETRAQELTAALWAHSDSPWHQRINMLGETKQDQAMVSQAAWIRSLMSTFVKSWEGRGIAIGGLFGAPVGTDTEALPWSQAQQTAFLILAGQKIQESIKNCKQSWATILRKDAQKNDSDPAYYGAYSLLNQDQGIRGILYTVNDLCYIRANKLKLGEWVKDEDASAADEQAVKNALKSLKAQPVAHFLTEIATALANYDWRTSSAPGLTEEQRTSKLALRGSGGYRELRRQLLLHLAKHSGDIQGAAKDVIKILDY